MEEELQGEGLQGGWGLWGEELQGGGGCCWDPSVSRAGPECSHTQLVPGAPHPHGHICAPLPEAPAHP